MNRKNWQAVGVIIVLLILLSVASYVYMDSFQSNGKKVNISVVVYGSTEERWIAFRQGVDQAASDFGALVNFVILSGTNDSEEQKEQMDRERANGTEGMVAAVTDSHQMSGYITTMANVVPIVLVESRIERDESLPCVAADSYKMGEELARLIMEKEDESVPITVVQIGDNRSSRRDRLEGFRNACASAGREVEQVVYPSRESMSRVLESSGTQILAALDDTGLEMTVNIVGESPENRKVYGIGSSRRIVSALDQGLIQGIVFQNEFNMGYEAVDTLIQKIRKGGAGEPKEIDYHRVTGETLHEPENERLLYPIIQ